jgi:SPP1 gp7 family putative phage head morphogenesis protein
MAGYYTTYYNVAQGLEVSVNFATIDKTGIERAIKERWDGRNYSDSVWNDKAKLIKSMQTILPRSFSMGLNSKTLGDMLAKELNVSKNRGRSLARTEINHLCNQAALDVYKACGVEQYQFLATLDMRTSEICRGMDGYIGKVTQAKVNVNYPPMHVNCRSTTIPYFQDDDTLDRIAKDEDGNNIKVPRRMTQEEWIKKYAPEEQRSKLLKFREKYSRDE